ncbi:MAG TPA: GGDEF domain-containing protein [Caulobacteraceae bacterium]|nr:GGDEF domain-containing protein [Caulobacteraceae bacterium]
MKTSAARSAPIAPIRRQGAAEARAGRGRAASLDHVEVLGLTDAELTPAVQSALAALMVELQALRGEAQRLKARLAEAEAAADEDPLTSARNRRAFGRELARVVAYARRYGTPASLLYVDVDGLKALNDRFGHAAGDAALRAVAACLASRVRASDVVGRLGGDEFAVLLANADQAAAEAKAAALARLIAAQPLRFGEQLIPLRVSWGACQIDPAKDPETLIAEADAAMFAMKRVRGRAA